MHASTIFNDVSVGQYKYKEDTLIYQNPARNVKSGSFDSSPYSEHIAAILVVLWDINDIHEIVFAHRDNIWQSLPVFPHYLFTS